MNLQGATIAVTGASGLVGGGCCRALMNAGATVRALVRDPSAVNTNGGAYRFELDGSTDPKALTGSVDVLIHCAYVLRGNRQQASKINVDGTRRLFDLATRAGVQRTLFVSSVAAHDQARSAYGRSKWVLEADVESRKGCSIKPGTIVGPGGMFARVRALVRKLPIMPVFYPRQMLQTVFIDDLITAILRSLERDTQGRLVLAEKDGVKQPQFYRGIAALEGKSRLLLRFPGDVALVGTLAIESLGLHAPITSDNLRGLRHVHHFDTAEANRLLDLQPREFRASILELARREGNEDAIRRISLRFPEA